MAFQRHLSPKGFSPCSFDGTPFFSSIDKNGGGNSIEIHSGNNNNYNVDESTDVFSGVGALSKFESFIERNSARKMEQNFEKPRNNVNALSPQSGSDLMSFVSRKKHDNYADVVEEMKRRQGRNDAKLNVRANNNYNNADESSPNTSFGDYQQQKHSTGNNWEFDHSFEDSSCFSQTHQKITFNSKPINSQRFGWDTSCGSNAFNDNTDSAVRGRKWNRDCLTLGNAHIAKVDENTQQQTQNKTNCKGFPNHQRSRSTVRRTVDSQRKIAQTYLNAKQETNAGDDNASDVGSVVSSVFMERGSQTMLRNSIFGEEKDSFNFNAAFESSNDFGRGKFGGSTFHQRREQRKSQKVDGSNDTVDTKLSGDHFALFPMQQSHNQKQSNLSDPLLMRSNCSNNSGNTLDLLLSWKANQTQNRDDDTCSVTSGASVAARRRAKAALKNSPIRPSVTSAASMTNTAHRGIAPTPSMKTPVIPPPSHSTSGARRNIRMRMLSKGQQSPRSYNENDTSSTLSKQQPSAHDHPLENEVPLFDAFDIAQIDDEVNMAIIELKLDHPELDFSFGRLGSSGGGSADSSVNSSSYNEGLGADGAYGSLAKVPLSPPISTKIIPSVCGKDIGVSDSINRGRISPITVSESVKTRSTKSVTAESSLDSHPLLHPMISNNVVLHPTTSDIFSSKPIESEQHISPIISVEQYSESSSLTDTGDWQNTSGGGGGTSRQNIFKDASKGSTFHKSKKIIRPGQSIPENVEQAVPKRTLDSDSTVFKKVEGLNVKDLEASPSIKDRIAKFKNDPAVVRYPRGSISHKVHEQEVDETVLTSSGTIDDQISRLKQDSIATTNFSPPSLLQPKTVNLNKNDKEKPTTIQNSTFSKLDVPSRVPISTTSNLSSSFDNPFAVKLRKTKNILDDIATHTRGLDNTSEENNDSNPFLSNVKLRKTGITTNTISDLMEDCTSNNSYVTYVSNNLSTSSTNEAALSVEEPKSKLNYREEQDLLKKTQPTHCSDSQKQKMENNRNLTYREQQDMKKQSQLAEMTQSPNVLEPKKNVATLIRERIALNKQNNMSSTMLPDLSNVHVKLKNSSHTADVSPKDRWKATGRPKESEVQSISMVYSCSLSSRENIDDKQQDTPQTIPSRADPQEDQSKNTHSGMLTHNNDMQANQQVEKDEEAPIDPRAALMAMLNKRASIAQDESNEDRFPKPNLEAMLAKRSVHNATQPDMLPNVSSSAAVKNKVYIPPNRHSHPDQSAPNVKLIGKADFSTSDVFDGNSSSDGSPALKNDPMYEKYFKMLKVGMPLPVVQHAMTRDGLDPRVMEGDHDKPVPKAKPINMPLKDDPAYAKYFKMLKLGLPMGAVKNAMERDGVDSSVMDGDHNAPAKSLPPNSAVTMKRQKDTHRRTRLHWDTLGKIKSNTVWALVEEDQELSKIEIDETEFTSLFQAEIKASSASTERGNGTTRNVVQVIDPKRANNGGIILARLKMSYDELAKAVEKIDETVMTANQAQGIIEYMPTLEERKALRYYMKTGEGDSASKFEKLCECEKFMVAMMTVKQSKRKLKALLFKLQFRGCIHDLAHDVFSIEKACDELSHSIRLRKLFGIVLNIGNRLNTAGPGEKRKAGAFTIKSLLKLNQAKAFDNKTTFLHYVVLVVQRNSESLLDFKDDLPTVSKADKIFWDQCERELEEVETQLENLQKLALHEAKAMKVIYQLPNKTQEDNDSDDLIIPSLTLEEEVSLLRSTKIGMFALSAIQKVSKLRERVDTARDKFRNLLEYFGEDAEHSKMQPHEFFDIISTFCRNFDVAREDVIKMEKAKKRDEKKDKGEGDTPQKNDTTSNKEKLVIDKQIPPQPSKKTMLRSSSFQPSMSNILADIKRVTSSKEQSASKESHKTSSLPKNAPPSQSATSQDNHQTLSQSCMSDEKKYLSTEMTSCVRSRNISQSTDRRESTRNEKDLHEEQSIPEVSVIEHPTIKRSDNVFVETALTDTRTSSHHGQTCYESEAGYFQVPCTVSSSGSASMDQSDSLTISTSHQSRQSVSARHQRARSKHFSQSSTASQSNVDAPNATLSDTQEVSVRSNSRSPVPSNSNSRAAARDRYARHRKLMVKMQSSNN